MLLPSISEVAERLIDEMEEKGTLKASLNAPVEASIPSRYLAGLTPCACGNVLDLSHPPTEMELLISQFRIVQVKMELYQYDIMSVYWRGPSWREHSRYSFLVGQCEECLRVYWSHQDTRCRIYDSFPGRR